MSDFFLHISGAGGAVSLEPRGTIDADGARELIDTVGSLRGRHMPMVAIELDGVTGLTRDAWRLLASTDLPVDVLVAGT